MSIREVKMFKVGLSGLCFSKQELIYLLSVGMKGSYYTFGLGGVRTVVPAVACGDGRRMIQVLKIWCELGFTGRRLLLSQRYYARLGLLDYIACYILLH